MGDTAVYSITKNPLCFVCHGEPDKGQEEFDCGGCRPDSSFLCKNKSQQSKICLNTYSKIPSGRISISSEQPCKGVDPDHLENGM